MWKYLFFYPAWLTWWSTRNLSEICYVMLLILVLQQERLLMARLMPQFCFDKSLLLSPHPQSNRHHNHQDHAWRSSLMSLIQYLPVQLPLPNLSLGIRTLPMSTMIYPHLWSSCYLLTPNLNAITTTTSAFIICGISTAAINIWIVPESSN